MKIYIEDLIEDFPEERDGEPKAKKARKEPRAVPKPMGYGNDYLVERMKKAKEIDDWYSLCDGVAKVAIMDGEELVLKDVTELIPEIAEIKQEYGTPKKISTPERGPRTVGTVGSSDVTKRLIDGSDDEAANTKGLADTDGSDTDGSDTYHDVSEFGTQSMSPKKEKKGGTRKSKKKKRMTKRKNIRKGTKKKRRKKRKTRK